MLNFLKKKKSLKKELEAETKDEKFSDVDEGSDDKGAFQEEDKKKDKNILSNLKNGLKRTRENFTNKISDLILGKKSIDEELIEEIETNLLTADVGVNTTNKIIEDLTKKIKRKDLNDSETLLDALKEQLKDIILTCEKSLEIPKSNKPFVILMIGVNGAGKTTTIGKLAKILQHQGKSVMLAAGDTFRAAAIEQLSTWGERNNIPVISQQTGADSASVIFDALQSATVKNCDVLIADTAGRLHTKDNLMKELQKVIRVIKKIDETAPHEVVLVLDATTGQNALNQAKKFHEDLNLSSIIITKLDGTAKGGILFAIANDLNLPIRYIGVGEKINDLKEFNGSEFVEALLSKQSED